ncbi:MAG: tail fiber protein [Pseudomonadota bacterium]
MKKILALLAALLFASPAQAVICGSAPFNLQEGTTASATQVMANFNATIACVNANAAANGANSDITSLSGLTTPLSAAQGGTNNYYATAVTSTPNTLVVTTVSPNAFTLVAGKILSFISTVSNTGATTMNAVSTGATAIYRATGSAGVTTLGGGEIVSGGLYNLMYDGSRYLLLNPSVTDDPGVVKDFAGATAPAGWQLTYGQIVAQAGYAGLYTAISTNWNTGGEGAGNFRLPDLRGRLAAGKDDMGGSAASRLTATSGCTGTTLGATCGDQRMQAHTHAAGTYVDSAAARGISTGSTPTPLRVTADGVGSLFGAVGTPPNLDIVRPSNGAVTGASGAVSSGAGGSSENVQPTAVVNKIIRN